MTDDNVALCAQQNYRLLLTQIRLTCAETNVVVEISTLRKYTSIEFL